MSLPEIPPAAVPFALSLIKAIVGFIGAGDDDAAQEDALMAAEAEIARFRANRKFAPRGPS